MNEIMPTVKQIPFEGPVIAEAMQLTPNLHVTLDM